MKKILALLMALMMMVLAVPALAEDEAVTMELTITKMISEAVEADAEAWFETSNNRAFLSILLFMDYLNATGHDASQYDITQSYLGYDDGLKMYQLRVKKDESNVMMITCMPEYMIANYINCAIPITFVPELELEGFEFKANDTDELMDVTSKLQDYFSK